MADDKEAIALFVEFGNNLGEFLGPWINKFRAGIIVIGGNVTGAYDLFGPSFESALNHQNISTKIALSGLMETSAMIGGARLLNEKFWKQVKTLLPKM